MGTTSQLDMLLEAMGRLGIKVRRERLGGGGGLCSIRGERVLFVDLDADAATRMETCLRAAASMPETDRVYLPPSVREAIDRLRLSQQG